VSLPSTDNPRRALRGLAQVRRGRVGAQALLLARAMASAIDIHLVD
jgi:hypothetical protein